MRNHRAVELLGARPRLPPLEEHDAVGAARHGLVAPQPHLSRRFRDVDVAPVDSACRLLHQHPRAPAAQRAHEVARHRRAHAGLGVGGVLVHIVADDVLALGPLPVVERLEEAHEVGGDRNVRRALSQRLTLDVVAGEQLVRREAHEVELLARIRPCRRPPRRQHLIPVRVALRPEVGPPRPVQVLDRAVSLLQPLAESVGGDVAVAVGDVAAELVAYMPHRQRGMLGVAGGHLLGQPPRGRAIDGAARTVVLPPAVPQPDAVDSHRQHLRMLVRHPRRGRGGGGGEVHRDAARVQLVHDPVEPREVVLSL